MAKHRTDKSTVACVLTPPGSGGIAVLEVRGPRAGAVVAAVFSPKSEGDWLGHPPGRLHYGHIRDGGDAVDEVLVRLASRDDEGEVIEINCHGGIVAAGETMRLLVGAGAVELPAAALAGRVAEERGLDSIQAEALRLLPAAETRLTARVLCDQLNGALSEAIRAIDSADGDAPARFDALAASAAFGLALVRPMRLVLVGCPNAGKSTLFNALVGHNRTIVSPVPGTTRDFINEFVALGGYPIELVDTAGLRRHGDVVEMKGVEATWGVVSDADLVVFVADGSRAMPDVERALLAALTPHDPIVALNKSDLGRPEEKVAAGLACCVVSALTGDGLAGLERAILDRFADPAAWPPGSAVAFTDDQRETLTAAGALARAGRADDAARRLAALTG